MVSSAISVPLSGSNDHTKDVEPRVQGMKIMYDGVDRVNAHFWPPVLNQVHNLTAEAKGWYCRIELQMDLHYI
jgi:hypothetical protein